MLILLVLFYLNVDNFLLNSFLIFIFNYVVFYKITPCLWNINNLWNFFDTQIIINFEINLLLNNLIDRLFYEGNEILIRHGIKFSFLKDLGIVRIHIIMNWMWKTMFYDDYILFILKYDVSINIQTLDFIRVTF